MLSLRMHIRLSVVLALVALFAFVLSEAAWAHERREVGPYLFIVGWTSEPAIVEQPNALDLRVLQADTEEPVLDMHEVLSAEVSFGDQTMPLELRPRFGEPGRYVADMIPTRPGSYIFHIEGEIEGERIDEHFNSADGEFSDVEQLSALQFPEPVDPVYELENELAATREAASSARLFGILGLVAGLLGLLAGGVALVRR